MDKKATINFVKANKAKDQTGNIFLIM